MSESIPIITISEIATNAAREIAELMEEKRKITEDRDSWKASHDNQVNLRRMLMDRPDLKERAKLIEKLTKENEELKKDLAIANEEWERWAKAHADLDAANNENCKTIARLTRELNELRNIT